MSLRSQFGFAFHKNSWKEYEGFAKENEQLEIVGGAYGDQELDVAGIKSLATMPSLDELRAKIISMLNTPATRIAGVVQAPAGQLARVVGAYSTKES